MSQLTVVVTRVQSLLCQYESMLKDCKDDIEEFYKGLEETGSEDPMYELEWITQLEQSEDHLERVVKSLKWVLMGGENPVK